MCCLLLELVFVWCGGGGLDLERVGGGLAGRLEVGVVVDARPRRDSPGVVSIVLMWG